MGMKKYLVFGLVIGLVTAFSLPQGVLGRSPDYANEIAKISTEIRLLNLINGLELDEEQMKFVIQRAEKAQQLETEFLSKVDNGNPEVAEVLQTFQELKDTLLKGENIPKDLKPQIHVAEGHVKEAKEEYRDGVTQLAHEIKEILQPHQIHVVCTPREPGHGCDR